MIDISLILDPKLIVSQSGFTDISSKKFRISTDSRSFIQGDCFVALVGDKFDGFDFVESVLNSQCEVVVYEINDKNVSKAKRLESEFKEILFVGVENSVKYLQNLSRLHLEKWKNISKSNIVIGITGSNGKTTQKDMLYHLLDSVVPGKVLATEKNFNNFIGVPLTLLRITEDIKIAIVEMGTNHYGEIATLCEICLPDVGIITNIGKSHLEFFKDESGVFEEKRALFDYIFKNEKENSIFVLNMDDNFLRNLPINPGVISFGRENGDCLIQILQDSVILSQAGGEVILQNETLTGEHNFFNLVSCFLLSVELFPENKEELIIAASNFTPRNNRSLWLENDGNRIFFDAYNANPSSMKASLKSFVEKCQADGFDMEECFFVIGEMGELGERSQELHQEIGEYLCELNAINIAFIGENCKFYVNNCIRQKKCLLFDDVNSFRSSWENIKKEHKCFFLKGSNSLHLVSLVDIK